MPKVDFALEYEKVKTQNKGYPVVIVAAGNSSRMQGTDKLFTNVLGLPVLIRTIKAFEQSPFISGIAVVTREDKIADVKRLAERYAINKLDFIVAGGASREESVKNGLMLYKYRTDKILVHDGARPLVSSQVVENVVSALKENDSVTCAVRVKDTIKTVDGNNFGAVTLKREELVSIQTPQGVDLEKFLAIAEGNNLSAFTDDTSVLEAAGILPKIVEGDYKNIKITTPEDLIIAEALIGSEF